MLTSTFIHAQGIGAKTEKKIWQSGATDWETFLDMYDDLGISAKHKAFALPVVEESIEKYEEADFGWFAKELPSSEHWRAFKSFGGKTGYLDIETTGMNSSAAVTIIGLYDGEEMKTYIKGHNLEEFLDDIRDYSVLVTYFGGGFDLPMLRSAFPGLTFDQIHMDLCPVLRRLGLKGGLKSIEEQMKIERVPETKGLDGFDAVRLWREYEWGSKESLDLLVSYNREDVVNLKPLAEYAYQEHRKRLLEE